MEASDEGTVEGSQGLAGPGQLVSCLGQFRDRAGVAGAGLLEPAGQVAGLAVVGGDTVGEVVGLLEEGEEFRARQRDRPHVLGRHGHGSTLQLGAADDGGRVDPVAAEGFRDDVGGRPVVVGDDVDVVAVPAAGHRHVDAPGVGRAIEQEEGAVDGTALGGVTRLGVAELDMLCHVVVREADGAARPMRDEVAAASDGGDGPAVAVADHGAPVGPKRAVVVPGHDLIADPELVGPGDCQCAVGCELAGGEAALLGELVEPDHRVVGRREHGDRLVVRAVLGPRLDHSAFGPTRAEAVDAAGLVVSGYSFRWRRSRGRKKR